MKSNYTFDNLEHPCVAVTIKLANDDIGVYGRTIYLRILTPGYSVETVDHLDQFIFGAFKGFFPDSDEPYRTILDSQKKWDELTEQIANEKMHREVDLWIISDRHAGMTGVANTVSMHYTVINPEMTNSVDSIIATIRLALEVEGDEVTSFRQFIVDFT